MRFGSTILSRVQGKVIHPYDSEFEKFRTVWNQGAEGRPDLIIVPENTGDVSLAVQYANECRRTVCVRGGGHHFAGLAVQDHAVMLHMRGMNKVHVDLSRKTVVVGAGATIGEIDAVTLPYGLAVPTGTSSGTGIAGLALGGGFGHLRRKFGLTADQLVRAQMVLASGDVIDVNSDDHDDLFWGIRGGGGNFGVVTEFEFALHTISPGVAVIDVFYPVTDFRHIMTQLVSTPRTAPDCVSFQLMISPLPNHSQYPPELHGQWVIRVLGMAAANSTEGVALLEPYRHLSEPVLDRSGVTQYLELQSRLNSNFPDGLYYDGASVFLDAITPQSIDAMETLLSDAQPVSFQLWMLGGILNRYTQDFTAFPVRKADWVIFVNAAGSSRDKLAPRARWMRHAVKEVGKLCTNPRVYVNAIGADDLLQGPIAENAYGSNYSKLQMLKRRYDVQNVFRHNVNVEP